MMTTGTPNSLVSFGDLGKPAEMLIKKVSEAVGGIFAPCQIKRVAKAEAESALIGAQSEIQVTDLHRRAMRRFVEEEARHQQNIETITGKALPHLEADAKPDNIEADWVTNFFAKSRIVADGEMQDLWAKVLAGEANAPGKYSKRTVNFLGDLDKTDAVLFQSLCGFGWQLGVFTPLILDRDAEICKSAGLDFEALTHLDSIGLIHFNHASRFVRTGISKRLSVSYHGRVLHLTLKNDSENRLDIGHVLLTKVGQELAAVCTRPDVEGLFDHVKGQWKAYFPEENKPEQEASPAGEPADTPSPTVS